MTINDDRFERSISAALHESAPKMLPRELLSRTEAEVDATRRRPRWIAMLREPTMRSGPTLTVGSPAVRLAAILIATILLAATLVGAGVAGARLVSPVAVIVVDQDGTGTVSTIGGAVDMAVDGDIILVRPGTYVEAVVIEKDVVIRGDGDAERIVITAPPDGPKTNVAANRGDPYALFVVDSAAVISDLTLAGPASAIHLSGGQPTIERVAFEGVGEPHTHSAGLRTFADAIVIADGSEASVRGNTLRNGGAVTVYDPSIALVLDNALSGGPSILAFTHRDGTIIERNRIDGALNRAIGTFGRGDTRIVGNTVVHPATAGISVGRRSSLGTDPVVQGNVISGASVGIHIAPDSNPRIQANTLSGNLTGLLAAANSDDVVVAGNRLIDNETGMAIGRTRLRIEDNSVSGGMAGIVITDGGSPTLERNLIEGASGRGLTIGAGTTPAVAANRICDNGINVFVDGDNELQLDASNEICPAGDQASADE